MKQLKAYQYFTIAFILAGGMTLSGYLLSLTFYKWQVASDVITVKGLAEREVRADWAQVPVRFSRSIILSKEEYDETGQQVIIPKLYNLIEADHQIIKDTLLSLGITNDEMISYEVISNTEDYRGEDGEHTDTKIIVQGNILVESTKVEAVSKINSAISHLMSKGISAITGSEKYHFSKLNDIKPEMIKEAVIAARAAGKELAGDTGSKLGRIKTANQGRFSIMDKGEDYSDNRRIEKKVRVVTEIKFYLK